MNPFGSVTDSIPGVGGDDKEDSGMSKEEAEEQERLRQEAIRQAERERRDKYKKQEEEREGVRQSIRDKYNIEKKENSDDEEEDEDEDDDDFGGGGKKAESDDPAERKIPISAGNSTAALRNCLISSVERTDLSRNLLFWKIQLLWN